MGKRKREKVRPFLVVLFFATRHYITTRFKGPPFLNPNSYVIHQTFSIYILHDASFNPFKFATYNSFPLITALTSGLCAGQTSSFTQTLAKRMFMDLTLDLVFSLQLFFP